MSNRVLCKFFAHGACLKGEHCEYAHDWSAPPNTICTYYQKGACSYGSRCRYDHIKISRQQSPASTSSANLSLMQQLPSGTASSGVSLTTDTADYPTSNGPLLLSSKLAWLNNTGQHNELQSDDDFADSRPSGPADRPICSFAAAGECPRGVNCPNMHGDLCPMCKKNCLHPFRPQEREEHLKMCEKRQKHLEALRRSQEIECSVCLERILTKPTPSERKFGILSECDHPFCIACIRNWRSTSPSSGMDANSTLRSCPICRKLSYFVIPSVIWYSSKEEKQEIVESYMAKLNSIDCKHFDFGNGTCPFGTSCFYKHAYRDGRLEEVALRHLGAEDGNTVIAKNIRLSDFLSNLHLR
ncbi:E3 ubiquitin-protein ligase makorin-like [Andrographis paniculata]|uniref:E3 ubiquitin-protein ligase makorin-like n=1 Tax=Andrographis paniculata TaxID=175694 RepID=UPI0021E8BE54|nr:E3 ubiquitin-protein ligase makorin-like [Andrographis paniculata]XP_051124248.1 E3 ubiquitin-protein ligase makorin-like [Andrographis paniculata]